jgi:8-oxo-dGTP pyrophosphatase MutT (NUDIX family)
VRTDWFSRLEQALNRRQTRDCGVPGLLPAAVLVPLLDRPDEPASVEVLLTVRSSDLENHPGQIAFPGGRVDPGETTLEAALRETVEEVGISVPGGDVLGKLCCRPSPAGYCAEPFVARLPWPQPLQLLEREVESVFTVPLNELLGITPDARQVEAETGSITLHSYRWQEWNIWGLTGNVLHELLEVIRADVGKAP